MAFSEVTDKKKASVKKAQDPSFLLHKLENVYQKLPQDHGGRHAIALRLARGLSLQAEENFLKAEKEKCQSCKKEAEVQARKALSFYRELSQIFPSKPNSYYPALFEVVEEILKDKSFEKRPVLASKDEDIRKAWEILEEFSVSNLSAKEKRKYHYHRMLVAKELLKLDELRASVSYLLGDRKLSEEEKEEALIWKMWLAELEFNFKEVLRILLVLGKDQVSKKYLLKLIQMAELSQTDPTPYYKNFIKRYPESNNVKVLVFSLLKKAPASSKKRVLKNYLSFFESDPEGLSYQVLEIDQGQLNMKWIKSFVSLDYMKDSPLEKFVLRYEGIKELERSLLKLSRYSPPSNLKRAISSYTRKMLELDEKLSDLLGKKEDWMFRVFTMSKWEKEVERFLSFLKKLPSSKLTKKPSFSKLIKAYEKQSKELKKEIKKLWAKDVKQSYLERMKKPETHALIKWELEKMLEVAREEEKTFFQALINTLRVKKEVKSLAVSSKEKELYQALKSDPFNPSLLAKLLVLQVEEEDQVLFYYLQNRIQEIKLGKSLPVRVW